MAKHKASLDFFNLIYQIRNKFVELCDKHKKRTGNQLMFPSGQAKNLKIVIKLYQRFGKKKLVFDDKDVPHVRDFMEWLVGKAAELAGTSPRPFNFDPAALIARGDEAKQVERALRGEAIIPKQGGGQIIV